MTRQQLRLAVGNFRELVFESFRDTGVKRASPNGLADISKLPELIGNVGISQSFGLLKGENIIVG